MTGKAVAGPGDAEDRRADRAASARAEVDALLAGLDRLREVVHRRLDHIESLAAEQAALTVPDPTDREDVLRQRVDELEAAQVRFQTEARRREQEWQSLTERLEDDRRLLAEAWERLEQQQIDAAGPAALAIPASQGPPGKVVKQADPDDPDDPVTRAVLRQFQTLQGDVRRNAGRRNGR